jgi:MFS-type transporter involved in bile tolerance (Atg22 family)
LLLRNHGSRPLKIIWALLDVIAIRHGLITGFIADRFGQTQVFLVGTLATLLGLERVLRMRCVG